MAKAKVTYTANGVQTTFAIPFTYIATTHIHVYLNNVEVDPGGLTFPSTSQVQLSEAPANGVTVKVQRITPRTAVPEFSAPSVLDPRDLTRALRAAVNIAEETEDTAADAIAAAEDLDAALTAAEGFRDAAQTAAGEAEAAETAAEAAAAAAATFNPALYQTRSEKGAASGYAPLDGDTKVPSANIPQIDYNSLANLPALFSGSYTDLTNKPSIGSTRGYISGLILSNAADATNDITVAAGVARNSANTADLELAASITKQLDAVWASGTNAGGRFAASISDALWYVFLISNGSTVDVGFSTNADPTSDPNYPVGYTSYRRIGFIVRASGAILGFTQDANAPDYFRLNAAVSEVSVTYNTTTTTVTVTSLCPPNCEADLSVYFAHSEFSADSVLYLRIKPTTETDAVAAYTNSDFTARSFSSGGTASLSNGPKRVFVDGARQYAYRKTNATGGATLTFLLNGWYDRRAA